MEFDDNEETDLRLLVITFAVRYGFEAEIFGCRPNVFSQESTPNDKIRNTVITMVITFQQNS